MKVSIAVHGRFHAFELASGLHQRGVLDSVLTTYPAGIARRFLPANVTLETAPWLEAQRRVAQWLGYGERVTFDIARRFGRFAAHRLPATATLLVGWSGASLETLGEARRRGLATIVERGSTHISHQTETLRAAYAEFGLPATVADPRLVDRELAEYELADAIAVGSEAAAASFVARGVSQTRLRVIPYGIDLARFSAPERVGGRTPARILFLGTVGVRKGVPSLLRAFARVSANCELHLVGPVEDGFWPILASMAGPRVVIRGPLRGHALLQAYHEADIFALASIEEGLALVLLQAMACGLPVVATPATGIGSIGGEESGALTVVANNPDALASALEGLVRDSERRLELGRRARRRAETAFDKTAYAERAFVAYREIVTRH